MYKIPANTLFVGKNLVFVPECHSTNDLAMKLAQQPSTPDGSVIITNRQLAGRGQRGNIWESSPGQNFTFSLLIKPSFLSIQDQFYLNIFTSLAILDYIKEKITSKAQIKWPNDVLIMGKKVCGILIENQLQGSQFSNSIVGIGLNMNQKNFAVDTATSLSVTVGRDFDLVIEHQHLLEKLEQRYLQLRQQHYKNLMADYLSSLYWAHEEHVFSSKSVEFTGVITGINKAGNLTVETREGIRYFDIKEIVYVR